MLAEDHSVELEREIHTLLARLRAVSAAPAGAEAALIKPWSEDVTLEGRRFGIRVSLLPPVGEGSDTRALIRLDPAPRLPAAWSHRLGLTARQAEVAALLTLAGSNKSIASALGMT